MYMYTAMADLAAELGDDGAASGPARCCGSDVTSTRMYVTGGFGPSASNEGFTTDYDLPNDTAYAETCASVALIFWAQRMLNLDLDGHYADVLELALYNGALSGLSRDGKHYFYENKLESDGTHRRWDWHPCPCCTMNVSRLVASIGGYFYSTGDDVIAIHLYGGNTADARDRRPAGAASRRPQLPLVRHDPHRRRTRTRRSRFSLKLRIPGWARRRDRHASTASRSTSPAATTRGYLDITREWSAGDTVELDLPMPPERVFAHPNVRDRCRPGRAPPRAAGLLRRAGRQSATPRSPSSPCRATPAIEAAERRDLFDGIVALTARGTRGERRRLGRRPLPRRARRPRHRRP